jgi:hypothetical protein
VTSGIHGGDPVKIHAASNDIMGVRLQRSEDRLHVVWLEETPGMWIYDARLYYMHGDLHGENWSVPRCLSETAVISLVNLLADDGEVFVAWSDHRFRTGDFSYPSNEAKAFVQHSLDDGDTFGRPTLLNEPMAPDDNAALLYVAPAGDDLLVYWAQRRDGIEGNTWRHGLLDRGLTMLKDWGPIGGDAIADAYRHRASKELRATVKSPPESPYSD